MALSRGRADCGPVPVGRRPAGLLRTAVSSQSVREELDCDAGSSGGARLVALRTCKAGRPPRPRRGGRPDCGPAPHPTRPAGLLRAPVSPQSVRGEVGCDAGSSGGARLVALRTCKAGHPPRPRGVGLVVTSALTSADVSLTSGSRSPDGTDGAAGSVTHSIFVRFTSNFVHLHSLPPLQGRIMSRFSLINFFQKIPTFWKFGTTLSCKSLRMGQTAFPLRVL